VVAELPAKIHPTGQLLAGDPAERLAAHSEALELIIAGSRRYGPLRAVLLGGVSGRLIRRGVPGRRHAAGRRAPARRPLRHGDERPRWTRDAELVTAGMVLARQRVGLRHLPPGAGGARARPGAGGELTVHGPGVIEMERREA
jgi:hypothetical protein